MTPETTETGRIVFVLLLFLELRRTACQLIASSTAEYIMFQFVGPGGAVPDLEFSVASSNLALGWSGKGSTLAM